ncbi:MAG: TonB-dependent receptor domain-containing protein [Acidobacteriaceae bacterium]
MAGFRRLSASAVLLLSVMVFDAAWPLHAQSSGNASSAAPMPGTPASVSTQGGIVRGVVKAGAVPLPGVSITATNTLTGKRYTTTTDASGNFSMSIPGNGRYVLKTELTAFAEVTKEVLFTSGVHEAQADFSLQLASRVQQEEAKQAASTATAAGGYPSQERGSARGMQSLSVLSSAANEIEAGMGSGNAGASMPSLGDLSSGGSDTATDSVAVSGQMGMTNPFANINEDDLRQRIQEQRALNGGQGGPGGGPGGGGFGGGGRGGGGGFGGRGFGGPGGMSAAFRKFNPFQPHGAVFYQGGNSALNAKTFSLTGQPVDKPAYNSNRYGFLLMGTPMIPGILKPSTKNFMFLGVFGTKNSSPFDQYASMPTLAERSGDFSSLTNRSGSVIPIYDPQTGQQFSYDGKANVIDPARIPSQAQALLAYLPAPNLPGTTNNLHTLTTAATNSTNVTARYVRNFGAGGGGAALPPFLQALMGTKGLRQNLNFSGNYMHTASDSLNVFPQLGGSTQMHQYALNLGYTLGYGRLTNNFALNWNRSHAVTNNYFTGKTDVAGNAGIPVGSIATSSNPFNYGVPGLKFSSFTGMSETAPSNRINQTISFTEGTSWSHKQHNVRFGFDIRRVHLDVLGGSNVTGAFTFTGYATKKPGDTSSGTQSSGSDFADYLLGLPQQSSVQAGNDKYYLRANVWDFYAQDDWRIRPNLTVLAGIRYEYFSPYSEKYDHMANLDHNADFTEVAEVLPNQVGPYSGKFPHSLVKPDRNNFAPRVGFAWQPIRKTVVRGGYGVNFNTSQYSNFVQQLAYQPPFAVTQTNITHEQGCGTLQLSNAFNCTTNGSTLIQNSFAVNLNYRLGYVQVWNLDVQRTLPGGVVMNVGYNGSKGTALDMLRAPNRGITGTSTATAQAFNFEDSLGFSNFNALAISVRRRLHSGLSLQATYQYSHSIDNASSIGGGTGVVAQNDKDLLAEEGNSSFDQRQRVRGNWVYELPFGPDAKYVTSGFFSRALNGLSLSGSYTFATGTPSTPHYAAAISEVARGSSGSLRPDRVAGSSLTEGGGSLKHWFNTSVFTAPVVSASNPFGYGNASRNSITGPGTVSVNMSFSKTVRMGETRSLEVRATADNVFNTVQYSGIDTTLGSQTYGQVTSVATMRQMTLQARFRF